MIDADTLTRDARALPALSATLKEVLRLLRIDSSSAADIERALLRDPGLTTNLLRVANSPIFARRGEIRSPGHAVTLLGRQRTRDLIITVGLKASLTQELPGYQMTAGGFVTHGMCVGYLAERIAERCLSGQQAPWFVAGLLHDMGKLVLSRHLAPHLHELLSQIELRAQLVWAERDLFGIDHTAAAGIVGSAWQLPSDIIEAARGHHDPSGLGPSQLVDVVHVANVAAHSLGYGEDVAGMSRSLDSAAFHRLGLSASQLERISSDALDALIEIKRSITTEERAS